MTKNILIKTWKQGYGDGKGFIVFSTFGCEHGRSRSFYVNIRKLWRLLDEGKAFYAGDMGNFLNAYKARNLNKECFFCFEFTWLSEKRNGELRGYRQSFDLSESKLRYILSEKETRCLYIPGEKVNSQKVKFDPNCKPVICNLLQDKRKRRALSKAMRDQFNGAGWGDVMLYADSRYDFGFVESDSNGRGIVGALILHETEVNGYPKCYFGMHT